MREKKKQKLPDTGAIRKGHPVEIRWPSWRSYGGKTPHDGLLVCDACGHSSWYVVGYPNSTEARICHNIHGHPGGKLCRFRDATPEERATAFAFLKKCEEQRAELRRLSAEKQAREIIYGVQSQ